LRARWQRIAVLAAGPGIQLVLWGVLYGLVRWVWSPGDLMGSPLLLLLVADLMYINLAWPILNLLPIWPLDGGQICREVGQAVSRPNGVVVALWISLVVSAALAVNALLAVNNQPHLPYFAGGWFMVLFFALFAAGSYQALQEEKSRGRYWDEDWPPW